MNLASEKQPLASEIITDLQKESKRKIIRRIVLP